MTDFENDFENEVNEIVNEVPEAPIEIPTEPEMDTVPVEEVPVEATVEAPVEGPKDEQVYVTIEDRMDEMYMHLYEQMHTHCCCEQMRDYTMEVAPLDRPLENIKESVQFDGVSIIKDPFPDTVLVGKWKKFNFCPFCGKRAILVMPYSYIGPDAPRLAGLLVNPQ